MNNNYLAHYGILGMKWGIRRTPRQLGYKNSHNSKKLAKQQEKILKNRAKKQKILSNPKKLYKHRNEFTEEEINTAMRKYKQGEQLRSVAGIKNKRNKTINKLISSNDASKLYNRKDEYSTQELREAFERIRLEDQIKNYANPPKSHVKKPSVFDTLMKAGVKASDAIKLGGEIKKNVQMVMNTNDNDKLYGYSNKKLYEIYKNPEKYSKKAIEQAQKQAKAMEDVKKVIRNRLKDPEVEWSKLDKKSIMISEDIIKKNKDIISNWTKKK